MAWLQRVRRFEINHVIDMKAFDVMQRPICKKVIVGRCVLCYERATTKTRVFEPVRTDILHLAATKDKRMMTMSFFAGAQPISSFICQVAKSSARAELDFVVSCDIGHYMRVLTRFSRRWRRVFFC